MFCPTCLAIVALRKTVHLNKQPELLKFVLIEILTVKRCTRPCITYERRRLMISSRGVDDVFTTLDAMMSRISDGKVVMFTPLVLQLSIPTRRDAERRWLVSREKRCQYRGFTRRKSSWPAHSLRWA
jgi:hypothetical protein